MAKSINPGWLKALGVALTPPATEPPAPTPLAVPAFTSWDEVQRMVERRIAAVDISALVVTGIQEALQRRQGRV